MMRLAHVPVAFAALSLAVAGCAVAPDSPPPAAGPQLLHLSTYVGADFVGPSGPPGPGLGWGTPASPTPQALPGAQCIASNDRGTWTFVTPGAVEVMRSAARLRVACRLEGYREASVELPCVTPRAEAGQAANGMFRAALHSGPLALVLIPALVIASTTAGPAAFLGVDAVAEPDICAYGGGRELRLYLEAAR